MAVSKEKKNPNRIPSLDTHLESNPDFRNGFKWVVLWKLNHKWQLCQDWFFHYYSMLPECQQCLFDSEGTTASKLYLWFSVWLHLSQGLEASGLNIAGLMGIFFFQCFFFLLLTLNALYKRHGQEEKQMESNLKECLLSIKLILVFQIYNTI